MTRWNKVRAVASWEFFSTVKRVGYLITTFGMPVFMLLYGGVLSSIGVFFAKKESEVRIYGVIDHARVLALSGDLSRSPLNIPEEIRSTLETLGEQSAMGPGLSWWENFVFRPFDDLDEARSRLEASDIKGLIVLPEDYVETGRIETYNREGIDFQGSNVREALEGLLTDRLLEGRVDEEVVDRVRKPIAETVRWTIKQDGTVEERSIAAQVAKLIVPLVFAILLFISQLMSAGYLLQGTAIEKENKLAEVILAAANPEEIMTGKLLGLGGAGLLQMLVWFGMILAGGLVFAGALQVGGVAIPWVGMIVGLFFFIAGYLFLGSLMLGTGSLGNNMRESQQYSMAWTLLTVVPMVFMQVLIFEPNGTLGRVLSFIPFTAPITVVLRITLEPEGIAWWEVLASFVMMGVSIWFALRIGARLFRVGLLLSGARPKIREIWRQARLSG